MSEFALAKIVNLSEAPTAESAREITVKINPTELSVSRGASYAEIAVPGMRIPLLQFVRGEAEVLEVELLLDGTDKRQVTKPDQPDSVAARLDALRKFVKIDPHLHAPPLCRFEWGQIAHEGVITSLRERFQLFDDAGNVLRARVTISIKSYKPAEAQARESSTQSPDRFKARVVREGDRLDLIAADEYGDPNLWRPIAELNGIGRPRQLTVGMVLHIPPL